MRKLLALLLLVALVRADFLIDRVDVVVSDIKADGSAAVHESIKFVMYGNYSTSLYDSGMSSNDLSFWSTNTELKDVKLHVNTATVDVRDFRLRPQPRTQCNPIQGICHGELILDYLAYPTYRNGTGTPVNGTGLFTILNYKPRTTRYSINPDSLAFTATPEGSILIDNNEHLTIDLPSGSMLVDINPRPPDFNADLPIHVDTLSWTDIVLVKFSLTFDVEEGIDKEVSDFFSNIAINASNLIMGPEGLALIVLIVILVGSYLYVSTAKRRGEG